MRFSSRFLFPPSMPFVPRLRLGLDIGRRHLRLAALRPRRSRLQVVGLAEHRFAHTICRRGRIADLELVGGTVRSMLQRCRVQAGVMGTALDMDSAAAVPLTLPAAADAVQRLAQVQAEMALRHPQPPDELVAHYCLLVPGADSGNGDELTVMALFVPLIDVDDRSALAHSLRLQPGCVALRESRIAAFLRQTHRLPLAGVLQIDLDQTWLALPGQPVLLLDWSAQDDPPATLLHALAPHLRTPTQRLVLSGDAPMLPDLARAIGKYSGLPAQVASMSPEVIQNGTGSVVTPAFFAALALAAGARP